MPPSAHSANLAATRVCFGGQSKDDITLQVSMFHVDVSEFTPVVTNRRAVSFIGMDQGEKKKSTGFFEDFGRYRLFSDSSAPPCVRRGGRRLRGDTLLLSRSICRSIVDASSIFLF